MGIGSGISNGPPDRPKSKSADFFFDEQEEHNDHDHDLGHGHHHHHHHDIAHGLMALNLDLSSSSRERCCSEPTTATIPTAADTRSRPLFSSKLRAGRLLPSAKAMLSVSFKRRMGGRPPSPPPDDAFVSPPPSLTLYPPPTGAVPGGGGLHVGGFASGGVFSAGEDTPPTKGIFEKRAGGGAAAGRGYHPGGVSGFIPSPFFRGQRRRSARVRSYNFGHPPATPPSPTGSGSLSGRISAGSLSARGFSGYLHGQLELPRGLDGGGSGAGGSGSGSVRELCFFVWL